MARGGLWPRPDGRRYDAEHGLVLDVDEQEGMAEQPGADTVAGGPEPATPACAAGEVDLGRVLDGEHASTAGGAQGALGGRRYDGLGGDRVVVEKPPRRHLAGPPAADLAQHQAALGDDGVEQLLAALRCATRISFVP
jgi:hypothetical protein